ncbi:hypothetical protein IJ118_02445 [Candidatus Saccharibacteria bacterium]|nr:hypothetical protein [Candidatus Saccharibacteria bacterium]
MGYRTFSVDNYRKARRDYGVTQSTDVTRQAEERARRTGHLSEIVDPAIGPIRFSKIRLNPHQKKWIATLGCPMDIEVSCDTTGSMGGEVDTEMNVLPELYDAVAKVLPGYDPQLCLGIFGDCGDDFVICRPQFEMEAPKIVNYLKEMAPQRGGRGNHGEDPQYAMFARAYLTDAYTNRIGLKGYHFIVTDEPYHNHLHEEEIRRIFGNEIFKNELKGIHRKLPSVKAMVNELKQKTHQFALVMRDYRYGDTLDLWRDLCGEKSVIVIDSTRQLPAVISAIIGLTEGTIEVVGLKEHLGKYGSSGLIAQLSNIDIGAQVKLRHALPHPVPKAGDIFAKKSDTWPIQPGDSPEEEPAETPDHIEYL